MWTGCGIPNMRSSSGGGQTGLMLVSELALAGAAIVGRGVNRELDGSRPGGLHSRTTDG